MVLGKQIHDNALIGQRGINLIEQITLKMGFAWHPSNQSLEAGLDGYIELRNPSTGQALNSVLFVQSKATDRDFHSETSSTFSFTCDQRDLEYWLKGNAPILLICSRPRTNEAYWVSLKEYFRDKHLLEQRRIVFEKSRDRFDENAAAALLRTGLPPGVGIYLGPAPKVEKLYSNLLKVSQYPLGIWVASTDYRRDFEIRSYFKDKNISMAGEWFLKEKKVISFYDLSEPPWTEICDQGTVERFESAEWAESELSDRRNEFVRLLNSSLRRKLHHLDIGYDKSLELFFFQLPEGKNEWVETYRSMSKNSSRHVVDYYPNRANPSLPGYYRHLAFGARFLLADGDWVLELTPSYRFTRDGDELLRRYEDLLKGIKRLERNAAVLGQAFFIADYLSRPPALFRKNTDLCFSHLVRFDSLVGIFDEEWLKQEEDQGVSIKAVSDEHLGLFE